MKRRRWERLSGRRTSEGAAGLTLLEVLFAVALLGMGIAVIVQGLALGLRVRRESEALREMSLVASSALDRLLTHGEAPSAEEEGEAGAYRWRIVPEPAAPGEEGEAGARLPLRIIVERKNGRSMEVVTAFPAGEEP